MVLITLGVTLFLSQSYLLAPLAKKYLKEYKVSYTKVEGTFFQGIILHDINYADTVKIKKLQVHYNLLSLLRPTPKITKIEIDGLFVATNKLPTSEDNTTTQITIFPFIIADIELKNTVIMAEDETIKFDLKTQDLFYHDSIDIRKLELNLQTSYANALISGHVLSNEFQGESSAQISSSIKQEYLDFLKNIPNKLAINIELNSDKIVLNTKLNNLTLKENKDVKIQDGNLSVAYIFSDYSLHANAKYKVLYQNFATLINQNFLLDNELKYTSDINASIEKDPFALPFKNINIAVLGDENTLKAQLQAGLIDCNISSHDYKSFLLLAEDTHLRAEIKLLIDKNLYKAVIYPKLENEIYKDLPITLFSPIKIQYEQMAQEDKIKIDANLLQATLSKKEKFLSGVGNLGSSEFSLAGKIDENPHINIQTKTESLQKLLSELTADKSKIIYNDSVKIVSTLDFGKTFCIQNDISMPRYTLKTEDKKPVGIENIFVSTNYCDKKLTINNYNATYMQQKLFSNKPASLLIDENITIKEFWLFEDLLTTGVIDTTKKEVYLNVKSDSFSYPFDDTNVTIKTDLNLTIDSLGKQKIDGKISLLNVTIKDKTLKLPFKNIQTFIKGDEKNIKINLQTDALNFYITSKDYEHFLINGEKKNFALSSFEAVPEKLKKDKLSFKTEALMQISPFSLKGTLKANDDYFKTDINFKLSETDILSQAQFTPKEALYKNYPIDLFSPINLKYKKNIQGQKLTMNANLFHATLSKKGDIIQGKGNIASSQFTLSSKQTQDKQISLELFTKIPSIKEFLSELHVDSKENSVSHDGELEIHSTLTFDEYFDIKSNIHLPWYTLMPDSDTIYLVEDIKLNTEYKNQKFIINNYSAHSMEQRLFANKPSTLFLDSDGNLQIQELWIYDNLLASGKIDTSKNEVNINLKSDGFHYESKDANITVKADITVQIDSSSKQKIEGEISLLGGTISYEPTQDYVVSDKDIIIIQNIKADYSANRFINLSIKSLVPIAYKTKDIHINLIPDIVIYQEFNTPLKLLGMVTINDGDVVGGDKEFVFDKSEIYFTGENPINPQLNMNLHYYTLDYIDIEIFITNSLSSPVIIFSSKPTMSQNDIMSYILFGEPATTLFESSEGATKASLSSLVLGTGLKEVFNKTAGIKVDTLNIVSNKEGTLGYEIGTRFNKNIRIIYKNDTASSVILQYSLSKSLRIDVDVQETGQGVNIIYVKDF